MAQGARSGVPLFVHRCNAPSATTRAAAIALPTSMPVGTTRMGEVTPRFLMRRAMLSLGAITPHSNLSFEIELLEVLTRDD